VGLRCRGEARVLEEKVSPCMAGIRWQENVNFLLSRLPWESHGPESGVDVGKDTSQKPKRGNKGDGCDP